MYVCDNYMMIILPFMEFLRTFILKAQVRQLVLGCCASVFCHLMNCFTCDLRSF